MSVEIDPQELGFRRPFIVEVSETLKIKNPNPYDVGFKVKTTAPKQYCVRPNSGRVGAGQEVEVQVILQAMKQEPPLDTKCRDKFLVQSVAIPGDKAFDGLTQIWESMDKSSIQEKKIRVVFLSADGAGAGPAQAATPKRQSTANGNDGTPDVAPPAYSSPTDYAPTSRPKSSQAGDDEFKTDDVPSAGGASASLSGPTNDMSYEQLKAELERAEQTVAQLKQDQGGVRQRKPGATAEEKPQPAQTAQAVRQGTEGVPVQITALLCLLCFLLAYFFF